jgi:hypothetical protein
MDLRRKLEAMLVLLSPPGAWTQDAVWRRGPDGEIASRCLYGAAIAVCGVDVEIREISRYLESKFEAGPLPGFIAWNDKGGRTQGEVLEFLRGCIEELEPEAVEEAPARVLEYA